MAIITNPKCEVCNSPPLADNVITETEYWRVVLATDQAYLGRSFVTLKNHKESLSELSHSEWEEFETLVKRLEDSYEKAFRSGRPFNWACMMNNAFKEAEPTPHVHWHVRPRHTQPITFDGREYIDPEYAHHYQPSRRSFLDQADLGVISAHLKKYI